jgi:hypothetical protein
MASWPHFHRRPYMLLKSGLRSPTLVQIDPHHYDMADEALSPNSCSYRLASSPRLQAVCLIQLKRASHVPSLSTCRRHLAGLLKEHSLVEGGDLQVATWIKDEGFDTTIPSVMQVQHPKSMHMSVLGSQWRRACACETARCSCNVLCTSC